uniref:DNA polymerase I n=1 Tax=uncultured Thiotrichaceae bacterium TaxID=298394 RepID=A0A6S6U7Q0_9GAMM|nr:MAG: DNA polymerase I (EC [uncultured Thiotrichaceae bacterium]
MTTATTKPLILVDGSSYLFRAFHALPPLTNSKGEPTGAIHGVLNMLDRLRKDYKPDYMVVIFDAPGKTFRDDMFPEYKANRPSMPDELRSQIEPLLDIIRAQGYPLLIVPDVEADDVIGTMATIYDGKVLISTGDKDMAQLVTEDIHLINTMSNTYSDIEGVKEKFGVPPERIKDYLALIGDKVDNVPGVEKVGPKTAVKWLDQYDTLANIIENADAFKGKVGENLREAVAHLPLSYDLVTIKCDLDIDCSPEALTFLQQDTERLDELYSRFELSTRLKALRSSTAATNDKTEPSAENDNSDEDTETPAEPNGNYETILTQADLNKWLEKLRDVALFAFDTETTSLDYMEAEVVAVSFAVEAGAAAYLPFAHDYIGAPEQLKRDDVLAQLKPLLEDDSIHKVGQNLKYDRSVLLNHGVELRGIAHDTMLQSYALDSTGRHDMDTLCLKHLGHSNISFETIAGKGKKQLTFNQIALEEAAPYAAEDADMTLQLHQHFWPQLEALDGQRKLYQDIEVPLVSVLSDIERNGVQVDAAMLGKQSQQLSERMEELVKQSYETAGEEFNLASPKQIQAIFFEKLGLPVIRKTPKGQPSTAEDVLEELAAMDHELPQLILEHRGLNKLKSTYTDKLPEQINPQTGRVHTSYHQAVTATGRLSSSDPNLQNIPIRNAEGRRIRQAFIAPEGFKILAADYSQIELRIMAHLSGDKGLLDAFAAGKDIHSATASEVFGVPLNEVVIEQRRAAKAVNFGLIYGMSAFGLAKQLNVSRGEAQSYVDLYFARYPGVQDYMDATKEQAKAQGYVETLFGRRLFLPEINARNAQRRQYAERTAINAPMQGTAADIIKQAMISVAGWLKTDGTRTRMIMQVHDELVFEVPEGEIDAVDAKVKKLMTGAAKLDVPLVVDSGIGINWDEAH